MNFMWVFFRKPLTSIQTHDLLFWFHPIFLKWIQFLKNIQPKHSYQEYNQRYSQNNAIADEIGVALQRIEGDECIIQPLIRMFLGTDNMLIYRQRIDSITYPILAHQEEYENLFQETRTSTLQFFQKNWNYSAMVNYNEISGQHSCLLNCGKCCDGSDYTRSPQLGGRYCKAVTTVGDLCLYRLYNPPYQPEDKVCGEYLCGMCQSTVNADNEGTGCGLYAFTPLYDSADREEFFDLMKKITQKEDISITTTFQTRAAEVEQYFIITALIDEILKPIQNQLPQFVEPFLFAIGRHYIDNCESLLTQYKDQLGIHYDRLNDALEGYAYWFDRYNNRRKHISKPIVLKEHFSC